jgi:hypothetical protein
MKAHELAQLLLAGPDAEVVLQVYRHRYRSDADAASHGKMHVTPALIGYKDSPAVVLSDGEFEPRRGDAGDR